MRQLSNTFLLPTIDTRRF